MQELYHAYGHKYINKYMGRNGRWVYVYKEMAEIEAKKKKKRWF